MGNTPLCSAIQDGQLDKVEALLNRWDLLLTIADLSAIIRIAYVEYVHLGQEAMVSLLRSNKKVKYAMNENWQECLNASFFSSSAVAAVLNCKDADQNMCIRWRSIQPAQKGWEYTLYGCDRNVGNVSTPLFRSVILGDYETATMLLDNGADIDKKRLRRLVAFSNGMFEGGP